MGDYSLLSCPLHCLFPVSHCSDLLPSTYPTPTAAMPCLSPPTTQTFHLTPLPITHTTLDLPFLPLPPAPASPLLPGLAQFSISRSRVYSHIWLPVLEAGMTGQGKERLRFETQRSAGGSCPLEGSAASFCVHPALFLVGRPPTVILVLSECSEMVLFIAAAGFPPAETYHH